MATRINPNLSENGPSAFEYRSEHGRHLLSDRDYVDERYNVLRALSAAPPASAEVTFGKQTKFRQQTIAESVTVYEEDLKKSSEEESDIFSADKERDFVTDYAEEPAGDKRIVDSYLALFPHRIESVIRYSDFAPWREVSRFHHLSDEEILATLRLDSKLRRSVRFDATSRIQVLHIPFESQYQNLPSANLLKQQFKKLGITVKHYQYNTDWYFYLFVADFIDSSILQAPITAMLQAAGFHISENDLDVCSANTPVPLPLQPGFAWINDRGHVTVRRDEISLQGALALFTSDAARCAVNVEKLLMMSFMLEPGSAAGDADCLQKLNQALRHP